MRGYNRRMSAARFESKVLSRDECRRRRRWRLPRPLVFTNGVFDILHRGHATYLDQAAQLGATLVVAVSTDSRSAAWSRRRAPALIAWKTAPRYLPRWAA